MSIKFNSITRPPRIRSVCSTLLAAAALAVSATSPVKASDGALFYGCGWYVVVSCHKTYSAADNAAGNALAIIDTGEYPNFRDGWLCAVDGPHRARSDASPILASWKAVKSDAYVKRGC